MDVNKNEIDKNNTTVKHFPDKVVSKLDSIFSKLEAKGKRPQIHIEKQGNVYSYPANSSNEPFHIASIGKLFTSVLIGMLIDEGKLNLDDKVINHQSDSILENLFKFNDVDYREEITVKQLITHTSGSADYFDGKVMSGRKFTDIVTSEPDSFWTPIDLLNFTRENQKPNSAPSIYYYSDTGYILLGLLIEKISGKSFHKNLHEKIFNPMNMDDSYLMFYSEPEIKDKKAIRKIMFNKIDITNFKSLSCDWSGGGIISTPVDLVKFIKALSSGKLVSKSYLNFMEDCPYKFRAGIYYGGGMMEIRFGDFLIFLRGLPKLKGHIGILATHTYYDPQNETYYVLNFGDTDEMSTSFRALSETVALISKS